MVHTTPVNDQTLRLLVVDDDRDGADSLALLLDAWGHQARAAYDGHQALAVARAEPFDAVLLDLGMPPPDGLRLARDLRQQWNARDAALVAVTGYADAGHRAAAWAAGVEHYLVKPVDLGALDRLLTDLLAARARAAHAWGRVRRAGGREPD